jgi:hypothetical protein
LSHWCLAAVPAAQALIDLGIDVEVVYAPLKEGAPLGYTTEMEKWFYQRGARAYNMELIASWCEGPQTGTWAANTAAFVAGEIVGSQLKSAQFMMSAAMQRGALVGRPQEAYAQAAQFAHVSAQEIECKANEARVREIMLDGNKRLTKLNADERPTWRLENANGDFAVIKGVWDKGAIASLANAMLHDQRAYAAAGDPPIFA